MSIQIQCTLFSIWHTGALKKWKPKQPAPMAVASILRPPFTLIWCTKVLVTNSWSHYGSSANCVSTTPVPSGAVLYWNNPIPCSQGEDPLSGEQSMNWRVNRKCTPDKCYEGEVPQAIRVGNRTSPEHEKTLQVLPLLPLTKGSQKMKTFWLLQKNEHDMDIFYTHIKFLMTDWFIGNFSCFLSVSLQETSPSIQAILSVSVVFTIGCSSELSGGLSKAWSHPGDSNLIGAVWELKNLKSNM